MIISENNIECEVVNNAWNAVKDFSTNVYRSINLLVSWSGNEVGTGVMWKRLGMPQVAEIEVKSTGDIGRAMALIGSAIISIETFGQVDLLKDDRIKYLTREILNLKNNFINKNMYIYNQKIYDVRICYNMTEKYLNMIEKLNIPYKETLSENIKEVSDYFNYIDEYKNKLNEIKKLYNEIINIDINKIINENTDTILQNDVLNYFSSTINIKGDTPKTLLNMYNEALNKAQKNLNFMFEQMNNAKQYQNYIVNSYINLNNARNQLITFISINYIITKDVKSENLIITSKNEYDKKVSIAIQNEKEKQKTISNIIGTGLIGLNLFLS